MNFRKGRIAAVGVGAVLAFAGIAGCGSSDDSSDSSSSSSGTELSKADFIKQADAICADAAAQSNASEKDFVSQYQSGDYNAAADTLAATAKVNENSFKDLRALKPPAADADEVDAILTAAEKQVALSSDFEDAVRNGDQAKITELSKEAKAISQDANAKADAYGLTGCGSGNQ